VGSEVGIELAVVWRSQPPGQRRGAARLERRTFYKGKTVDPAEGRAPERRPAGARERSELHAELERLFQPYARQIADEIWGKNDALPDPELVAIQGFESCPRCWTRDEDCGACNGSGMLRRG
jgi:hypothetical protein